MTLSVSFSKSNVSGAHLISTIAICFPSRCTVHHDYSKYPGTRQQRDRENEEYKSVQKVPSYDDPPTEMKPLKDNEVPMFLQAIKDNQFEALFYVALFTGMRESELIGLTWDCIDFQHNTIHIYRQLRKTRGKKGQYVFTSLKNKQARTFSPPQNVMDTLRKVKIRQSEYRLKAGTSWLNTDDLVFTTDLGKHIATFTLYKHFKETVTKIGLPEMRFHDLRHPDVKQATKNYGRFIRKLRSDDR